MPLVPLRLPAVVGVLLLLLAPLPAQALDDPPPFGFVGAEIQPVTLDMALALGMDAPSGVAVRDLVPWGPAYQAGLRRSDLLLTWDGVVVTGLQHLVGLVQGTRPGDVVPVTRRRLGAEQTLPLILSDYPPGWSVRTEARAVLPRLGLTLVSLTPQAREQAALRWGSTGVIAWQVEAGSPAAALGIAENELLVAVDGERLVDPAEAEFLLTEEARLLVEGTGGYRLVAMNGAPLPPAVTAAGATWQPLPEGGLMVLDVAHRTPAAGAGLHPGDRVEAVDGTPKPDADAALRLAVAPAELTVRGMGDTAVRTVSLTPDPESSPAEAVALIGALEAAVSTLTPAQRAAFDLRPSARGVVLTSVQVGGRAGEAGLRPGYVIGAVNQRPVVRPADVHDELDAAIAAQVPEAVLLVEGPQGFRLVGLPLTDGDEPAHGLHPPPGEAPLLQWGTPAE